MMISLPRCCVRISRHLPSYISTSSDSSASISAITSRSLATSSSHQSPSSSSSSPCSRRPFSSSRPIRQRTPAEVEAHRQTILAQRRQRFEEFDKLSSEPTSPPPARPAPTRPSKALKGPAKGPASTDVSDPYSQLSPTPKPETSVESSPPAQALQPSSATPENSNNSTTPYEDTFPESDYANLAKLYTTSRTVLSTSTIPPTLPVQSPLPDSKGLTPSAHPIPFASFLSHPSVTPFLEQGYLPALTSLAKYNTYPKSRNIVKLLTPEEFTLANKAQRESVSGSKKSSSSGAAKPLVGRNTGLRNDGIPKELFITWVSSPNDLSHKAKQAKEFLEKGWRLKLEFSKRRKGGNRDPVLPRDRKMEVMDEFFDGLGGVGEKIKEFEWADSTNKAWMTIDPTKTIRERLKAEDRARAKEGGDSEKSKKELAKEKQQAYLEKKRLGKEEAMA